MAQSFEVLRNKMSLKAQLQAKEEAAKILEEIRRSHANPKPLDDSPNRNHLDGLDALAKLLPKG
ncbi:hypothetical protein [Phormidium sp. CCY1219]|uniref:hypothetical protein n=1 Tax=Phormidium sp. CCY1219 TaxID=2886104 RepID=UPI002D1E57C4|nr:hypothetical protein [Phormidium sp. CCY1219]MEB3827045.1 hypothetical protein [Phormidium sp. CCY1219]